MAQTVILEPPAKPADTSAAAAPAGKTNFGEKFKEAFGKEGGQEKAAVPSKAAAEKPQVDPDKDKKAPPPKPSALDLALADDNAPPPAKTEETDDLLNKLDAIKVPKSEHWDQARAGLRSRDENINTLKAELEKTKGDLGKVDPKVGESLALTTKERDELKAKNAELVDAITAINVEYDPEFQAKYVKGREKLVDRAVSRVKEYGGNIDQFADALSLTGKQRTQALKEALADVDEIDRPRIISVLDDIQKLDDERNDLRKDPQQAFERLSASRREEQEQRAADFNRVRKIEFEKTDQTLRSNVAFRQIGDNKWDEGVSGAFSRADLHFQPDAPISKLREIAVKGERFDEVFSMLVETNRELAASRKINREYEESSPDFRGSKKADTTVDKTRPQKYHEALAAQTGGGDDGV